MKVLTRRLGSEFFWIANIVRPSRTLAALTIVGLLAPSLVAIAAPGGTYNLAVNEPVPVSGTVATMSGTGFVNASGANENTTHIAIDWNEDKGGVQDSGDAEILDDSIVDITCDADGCDVVWGPIAHDYAGAGGGTYTVYAFIYHGNIPGNDGFTSSGQIDISEIVIPDTTDPVVTVSSPTVEATGPSGAAVNFTVTVTDDVDMGLTATCDFNSGDTFSLGATVVTCEATDTAGNTGSGTGTMTVQDTTPPMITLNGSDTVNLFVGDTYTEEGATATDIVDGPVTVDIGGDTVNEAVPGTYFVTYDAVDVAGNNAIQVTRVVTVSDAGDPVVTVTPPSQIVEATGPSGAPANFTVTAIDDVDGDISGSATCNPISGSTFSFGTTNIICTATDSSANTGEGGGTVTVVDTLAPVITLTGNSTVSLIKDVDNYNEEGATANDIVDGPFAAIVGGDIVDTGTVGTYIVTYNAVDAAGNHATEAIRTISVALAPDTAPPQSNFDSESENIFEVINTESPLTALSGSSTDFPTIGGSGVASIEMTIYQLADEETMDTEGFFVPVTEGEEQLPPPFEALICDENQLVLGDPIELNPAGHGAMTVAWEHNFEIPARGVYCAIVHATDVAGNVENTAVAGPFAYTYTPPAPTSPPSSGGGGGGGGNSSGSVLGVSTGPTGEVLGESCGLYMNQHLRMGSPKNDPGQVTRLQEFLNKNGFGTFAPTGYFGALTFAAVKAFQSAYADDILAPWDIAAPTGIVYLTTTRKLNLIECPELTLPLLELVPWNLNPFAQ